MKKLLILLLALVMCLAAFTSCDFLSSLINPVEPPAEETQADVAITLIKNDYQDYEKKGTAGDLAGLPTAMLQGDVTVSWSIVSNAEYVALVSVPGENGDPDTYKIDVNTDIDHDADVPYTLTAKVVDKEGNEKSITFNLFVPKFQPASHEDYMNAKSGDILTVEGIVVAMNSVKAGNKRNHLFLADVNGEGGYYCYNMKTDPLDDGIQVGMTVRVSGAISPSNGMQEFYQAEFVKIVDSEIKTVDPIDITDLFVNGGNLDAYVAHPVTIKGVTLGGQSLAVETDQYLFFEVGGKTSYIRTYYTDLPHTLVATNGDKTHKLAIEADHAEHYGWVADVTGILVYFSGTPYLVPLEVECFTNYVEPQRTDAEKVEFEMSGISLPENVDENTTITLPIVGSKYEEVVLSWAIDNVNYTIDENGKLVVKLGDEAVKLTLTLTAKCGDATKTKDYVINVKALSKGVYVVDEHITAPEADTAYKFYLYNATLEKFLYFNGTISSKYLGTSENAADGVDVYLEKVLGEGDAVLGYRFYFMNGETKTYIDITADGAAALVTENPAAVYNYVAETNIWAATVGGTEYYLGTYVNNGKTYTTMSASKSSYINADNTGKTQYPAGFATLAPATYVPNDQAGDATVDTAYKFYLYNATLEKFLYFNGTISSKYLGTSENAADGVDVYLEKVLGEGDAVLGYRFYFMNGETKTYIDITADGAAALVTENPAAVYNYVAETNIWAATVGGTEYYLGTYVNNGKTYTTMSASKSSYVNADNTGKTQYPAGFATLTAKEVAPEAQPTPEEKVAYKFYLYNATLEKLLYFNGTISSKYLGTSTDPYDAVDVYVEKVLGEGDAVLGYRFYFMNGETKTYIDITADGAAALVTENPAAVYNYVAETNIWAATVGGTEYYLGTYVNNGKTYTTMSASKSSYINADNTGKTQYPAGLALMKVVEDGETPTPDPNPVEVTISEANELEDGTKVIISGQVVRVNEAWSSYNNMSVYISDGTNEFYVFRMTTQVKLGDVITVTGAIGSYQGSKQIAQGATAVVTGHEHIYENVVTTKPTCTTDGAATPTCSCGETKDEVTLPALHKVSGTCSVCDLVIVNVSDLTVGTTTDAELVAGTGVSASTGLAIEANGKSIDGFKFTNRLKLGGTMKVEDGGVSAGIKIVTEGPATITVYGMASSSNATGRTLQLATLTDGALVKVAETAEVGGASIAKYELTVSEAGTYYLGSTDSGINLYYIAVATEVEQGGDETPATATISFADKANRTTQTTETQVWVQNGVTVTNNKAGSTSNVADYANPARFYKSSSLTVEFNGMKTIVFDCNSDSYATALAAAITNDGATVTVDADKVTVVLATAADSFTIESLSGGQVRVDGITVSQ